MQNPAYVGNGLYCSSQCINRGPLRIQRERAAMQAELHRRKVRFLPAQVTRRIRASVTIGAVDIQ